MDVRQALSQAYATAHTGSGRAAALAELRAAVIGSQKAAEDARRHLADLTVVVAARSRGGRCGCYISEFTHGLLTEALDGTENVGTPTEPAA